MHENRWASPSHSSQQSAILEKQINIHILKAVFSSPNYLSNSSSIYIEIILNSMKNRVLALLFFTLLLTTPVVKSDTIQIFNYGVNPKNTPSSGRLKEEKI